MNFRQIIRDYFTFSRGERKGIIILLILIFFLAVTNKLIFYFEKPARIDLALLDSAKQELATYNDSITQKSSKPTYSGYSEVQINSGVNQKSEALSPSSELFTFDPNKATDDDFHRLGFSEKQITSIRKYMANGVVFRSKEDFYKIRIITEDQKRILSGYVVIEGVSKLPVKEEFTSPQMLIELNSADSILLKQLPGIGDKLSKRIVKYRDLLGGFHSINQLKEVYGLDETIIKTINNKISIDRAKIKKLDLNFSDQAELSRHPYLQLNLAKKIIKFRTKYGSINDCSILQDSMILNIDEYNRLKPYL
jgi:DNA uptake protein ComE-like DNA-binding protein